jgi:hypothetical protein
MSYAKYTNRLDAEGLIRHIAFDYVEMSYDKVHYKYLAHIQQCREWLSSRPKPPPEPEQYELPFWGVYDDDF